MRDRYMETPASRAGRYVAGVLGIVALGMALLAGSVGYWTLASWAFVVFLAVPWLTFLAHLAATRCLSADEKRVWRSELRVSHRAIVALWSYLFAADLRKRTAGFAHYRGSEVPAREDVTPPIIVAEDADVTFHASLEDATASMEGVDVEDGIYKVFDALGRRIEVRAEGVHRGRLVLDIGTVHVGAVEANPTGAAELREILIQHLRRCGTPASESDDLPALVKAAMRRG
jgi:hypothetical protein